MAPTKGKQGTKGQKQILEENKSTLQFYLYVISGVNVVYFTLTYFLFWSSFTALYMFLACVVVCVLAGSYKFLGMMTKATYSPTGVLLDAGTDLNMEGGMAEHAKDVILLMCGVQLLALVSNYFWLLSLLAPGRAVYMLWVHFIGPWIFAPAPEDTPLSDKKQRKLERKQIRRQ